MGNYRRLAIAAAAAGWLACIPAHAAGDPTITAGELDRVFAAIQQNDWQLVEKEVTPLIGRPSPAQRYLIARLRYIYLISLASQLEQGTLKYADLRKRLSGIEKRLIIQPWHPVAPNSDSCFNQICTKEDDPAVLFTIQSNNKATQIYCFEYFDMGSPVDIGSFEGQNARLGGILDTIEINKNLPKAEKAGATVTWFFRLKVKDGFIGYER